MKKCFSTIILFLIVLMSVGQQAAVDTMTVYSQSMQRDIKTVVIKPANYKKKGNRYPVVYLLHGYGGGYANWITRVPALKDHATTYNVIIVCPNGENGWYINSPVNKASQYENFVSKELVNFIDSNYNSIPSKEQRAITGLSMGGHGGLMIGIRHKDKFGAAGSMSGALDLTGIVSKYDITKLIGDTIQFKWRDYSVLHLADSISTKGIKLIFDCGVNDFLIQSSRDLHAKLNEQKVPHDYIERPGAHTWPYWSNAIGYQLLFFRKFFDEADAKKL
ncbi:MAG: esterase family protein [Sphingobacteriales bacterium]|nr:MAG: esterase family protein [Sphingobacteriales bacterium]